MGDFFFFLVVKCRTDRGVALEEFVLGRWLQEEGFVLALVHGQGRHSGRSDSQLLTLNDCENAEN